MAEAKTRTIAGIYEAQGHYPAALGIYIELLKENPFDSNLTADIKRLQEVIKMRKESLLQDLLQKFKKYRESQR